MFGDWSYIMGGIVSASIAGGFGVYIAHIARQTRSQVTPSNGTTTANLVELLRKSQLDIAQDLELANQKLATDRMGALADRAIVKQHIEQDLAFQAKVTPVLDRMEAFLGTQPPTV